MSDKVKIAFIVATALVAAVGLWVYFSPYQTCLRSFPDGYTYRESPIGSGEFVRDQTAAFACAWAARNSN